MIELQRLSAMRPTEVCVMRTIDVNTQGRLWEYRPIENKMEHRDRDRIVQLGPRAQRILAPWLKTDLEAFLFSPREAMTEYRAQARAARKTPVQPSQVSRKVKRPKRTPGERYTYRSYSRAIRKACVAARVPHWARINSVIFAERGCGERTDWKPASACSDMLEPMSHRSMRNAMPNWLAQ